MILTSSTETNNQTYIVRDAQDDIYINATLEWSC